MPPSVAISGVDGFVGRHLARAFADRGFAVHGVSGGPIADGDPFLDLLASVRHADLRRGWPSDAVADAYVNLAGLAAVGPSFADPDRYISTNTAVATALCEHALANGGGRVVLISTGGVYAPSAEPVTEASPVRVSSPYVVSKLAMELQAEYYRERGLEVVVARPFNHIGPGQRQGFLVPDLAAKLAELPPGEHLPVGNLATFRDYTDVRDVAEAYVRLATQPVGRVLYNVASGRAVSGYEILALIAAEMGIETPATDSPEALARPTDNPFVCGDATALREDTGWQPTIDTTTSIRNFLAAAA